MTERLPQLKSTEVIRALERLGFLVRRQTGGHVILRHPTTRRFTVVPVHTTDVDRQLLFTILKQAGISRDQFLSVL